MKKLALLLLLTSCSMSDIVEQPKPRTKADTIAYQPRRNDTTNTSDIPIGFDVSVEDWDEGN